MDNRIPDITVSYAQSLDGRIATSTGDSRWISSPKTLRLAHRLRRDHQGLLVGIGTVLRDDPELTCRLRNCPSPVRVVLDAALRLPLESKIVRTAGTCRTLVLAAEGAPQERRARLEEAGVRVLEVPAGQPDLQEEGRREIPLRPALEKLAEEGLASLMVEGGGRVITSFLREGLVRRLVVVTAPLLIGRGVEAVGDLEVRSLPQALRPRRYRTYRLGRDLVWELFFDGA